MTVVPPPAAVGDLVHDTASGRIGVLMAVEANTDPATRRPLPPLVYLRPQCGGLEWTTRPEMITPATGGGPCAHPVTSKGDDGTTSCATCGHQLYL